MKTPTLIIMALILANASFAVDPPPDGGYPNQNTAEGEDALLNLTTGTDNTALGFNALLSDTTGIQNIAVGSQALASDTTGGFNVAVGYQALFSSQSGGGNVAIGHQALSESISGINNTAIGEGALYSNQGSSNTAIGWAAATLNTSGNSNTTVGYSTLYANRGSNNCAFGAYALGANTINTGSNNTGVGMNALLENLGSNNTALGYSAGWTATGDNNIFVGYYAGASAAGGDNNIEIGSHGKQGDTGRIRIGTEGVQTGVYIAGIFGTIINGAPVMINAQGHLGVVTSSARYKEKIKPMAESSEAILSLKPVTFRYKKELDPEAIPQFGLIAEDVAKVDPDLIAKDDQGKPYTVRYEAVNAMLLNEFLKEHKKVEQLEKQLQQMAARLDAKGL